MIYDPSEAWRAWKALIEIGIANLTEEQLARFNEFLGDGFPFADEESAPPARPADA